MSIQKMVKRFKGERSHILFLLLHRMVEISFKLSCEDVFGEKKE